MHFGMSWWWPRSNAHIQSILGLDTLKLHLVSSRQESHFSWSAMPLATPNQRLLTTKSSSWITLQTNSVRVSVWDQWQVELWRWLRMPLQTKPGSIAVWLMLNGRRGVIWYQRLLQQLSLSTVSISCGVSLAGPLYEDALPHFSIYSSKIPALVGIHVIDRLQCMY